MLLRSPNSHGLTAPPLVINLDAFITCKISRYLAYRISLAHCNGLSGAVYRFCPPPFASRRLGVSGSCSKREREFGDGEGKGGGWMVGVGRWKRKGSGDLYLEIGNRRSTEELISA